MRNEMKKASVFKQYFVMKMAGKCNICVIWKIQFQCKRMRYHSQLTTVIHELGGTLALPNYSGQLIAGFRLR